MQLSGLQQKPIVIGRLSVTADYNKIRFQEKSKSIPGADSNRKLQRWRARSMFHLQNCHWHRHYRRWGPCAIRNVAFITSMARIMPLSAAPSTFLNDPIGTNT